MKLTFRAGLYVRLCPGSITDKQIASLKLLVIHTTFYSNQSIGTFIFNSPWTQDTLKALKARTWADPFEGVSLDRTSAEGREGRGR